MSLRRTVGFIYLGKGIAMMVVLAIAIYFDLKK